MVKSQPKNTKKYVCNKLEAAGRQVSVSTVKCVLHLHGLIGCHARKKPLVQTGHLKAQLKFAADHIDEEKTFWRKTLWLDETKTELLGPMSSSIFGGKKVRPLTHRSPYHDCAEETSLPGSQQI